MRQLGQDLGMDTLEISRIAIDDVDEIIGRASDQMAGQHLGHFGDCRFERVEDFSSLTVQCYLHESVAGQSRWPEPENSPVWN